MCPAAALLEALGFEVERHPVEDAAVRAVGILSAVHLVVRPGEIWSCDPCGAEIRDGWMYGRGGVEV